MPDQIVQRIAEVLMAHLDESTLDPETNFSKAVCGCGWKPPYRNTSLEDAVLVHARHVAEVLVSELGLTAEWALTSGGGRQTVMSERPEGGRRCRTCKRLRQRKRAA
jgi:hypothetical protein